MKREHLKLHRTVSVAPETVIITSDPLAVFGTGCDSMVIISVVPAVFSVADFTATLLGSNAP